MTFSRWPVGAAIGLASGIAFGACTAVGAFMPICGLQSPEDLELLPDGRRVLISEMAGDHGKAGQFAVLDVGKRRVTDVIVEKATQNDWGDPHCTQRPASEISPHGFFLSRPQQVRLTLLAINHGDTESVHAYDLSTRDGVVHLAWRGCIDTSYNFNDLAATVDGFIGAHQYDKPMGEGPDAEKRLFGGANTGFAVRWSQSAGFKKIPGTDAAFPNGITVSADGKTAWMAATSGRQVRKIDLVNDVQVASAPLPLAPDNLSWTPDGQLLVTGADDVHRLARCASQVPPCKVPFAVARIDPNTLHSEVIFRHDGSMLMGASVAIITRGRMYIGSFAGDHILETTAPRVR